LKTPKAESQGEYLKL